MKPWMPSTVFAHRVFSNETLNATHLAEFHQACVLRGRGRVSYFFLDWILGMQSCFSIGPGSGSGKPK
jgi:phenylalanyl-tRNA synthetase alpha subunit